MTSLYFERFGERPGGAMPVARHGSIRRLFGPTSGGGAMRALEGLFAPAASRAPAEERPTRSAMAIQQAASAPMDSEIDCSGDT